MQNTPEPHLIRLRKPWQKTVDGSEDSARIDVPEPASEVPLTTATYERRFNQPSGLESDSQILLRIEAWEGDLLSLNVNDSQFNVVTAPAEIDITSAVNAHNTITIRIAAQDNTPPRLSGAVTLAII